MQQTYAHCRDCNLAFENTTVLRIPSVDSLFNSCCFPIEVVVKKKTPLFALQMLLGGAIDVECLFLSWCKDNTAAHLFTSQHPTSVSWHYRESSWCLVFGKCHLTCCCCCLRWTCCCLGWTQGRNLICLKRTKSPFTKRQGENSLQTPWWQQYPNLCCENCSFLLSPVFLTGKLIRCRVPMSCTPFSVIIAWRFKMTSGWRVAAVVSSHPATESHSTHCPLTQFVF